MLARLRTHNEWLAPDGHKVCEDRRTVTFYHTQAVRIIDFEIVIEATAGPVTFGDTKEGMFGLRLASSMDVKKKKGGKITNAEGLTDDRAWGQASPWVDYVGPVKGKTVGIAILNHTAASGSRRPGTSGTTACSRPIRSAGRISADHDRGDHTCGPGNPWFRLPDHPPSGRHCFSGSPGVLPGL